MTGPRGRAPALLATRVGRWTVLIGVGDVLEVVPRVAVRPLPGAPASVAGVLVHRGHEAVVVDLRERFGAPAPTRAWDAFVVVRGEPRWALVVDTADDVRALSPESRISRALPTERIAGVVLGEDDAALLVDPLALLDVEEHARLRDALAARGGER